MRTKGILLLTTAILCSAVASKAAQDSIGSVISLEGSARAIAADETDRSLELKSDVFLNDKIVTKTESKVQIMFDDDSVISQGENSEMTIDKYVYNPAKKEDNESTVKFTKGMFRVVSGEITKINPDRFKVKTRKATIGIRGCELGFRISEDRDDIYILYLPIGKDITIDAIGAIDQGLASDNIQRSLVVDRSGVAVSIHKGGAVDERQILPGEASAVFNDRRRAGGGSDNDDAGDVVGTSQQDPEDTIDDYADAQRVQSDEDGDLVTYPPLPEGPGDDAGAPSTSAPNTEPPILVGGHPVNNDWEWSITESGTVFYSPNRYLDTEFVPAADFANIVGAGVNYSLSGSGQCGAMLHDHNAGVSTLVQGFCSMNVSIGGVPTPAWGGTFMMDDGSPSPTHSLMIVIDSASLGGGFDASGNLTLNSVYTLNMNLNGTTFTEGDISGTPTVGGQLVRPTGASIPTGVAGEMHLTFGTSANSDVAFGSDLN